MPSYVNPAYSESELTGKIINCAMQVHKVLGTGFQEVVYQRSLAVEMTEQGIPFSREYEMAIYYKNQVVGSRRVDFLVDSIIMVELKAISQLEDVHLAQAMNYLEAYELKIGLLINFGAQLLQVKRVTNKRIS